MHRQKQQRMLLTYTLITFVLQSKKGACLRDSFVIIPHKSIVVSLFLVFVFEVGYRRTFSIYKIASYHRTVVWLSLFPSCQYYSIIPSAFTLVGTVLSRTYRDFYSELFVYFIVYIPLYLLCLQLLEVIHHISFHACVVTFKTDKVMLISQYQRTLLAN